MKTRNSIYFLIFILFSCSVDQEEWLNTNRFLSNYNTNGKLSYCIEQTWDKEQWLNLEKKMYTYDLNGNEIETLYLNWINDAWENGDIEKREYDSKNRISKEISTYWSNSKWKEPDESIYNYEDNLKLNQITDFRFLNGRLVETQKRFKKYDEFGNEIESWYEARKSYYDEQGKLHYSDEWNDSFNRHVNKVDEKGNIIEKQFQVVDNGGWKLIENTIMNYNSNNQIVSKILKKVKGLGGDSLVNVNKTEISYNEFGKKTEVLSTWENNNWNNSNQNKCYYDENGLLIERVFQEWKNNAWVNSFNSKYKYDTNGNEVERMIRQYNR